MLRNKRTQANTIPQLFCFLYAHKYVQEIPDLVNLNIVLKKLDLVKDQKPY